MLGDDEHHLAVFDDASSPGVLHQVLGGTLPDGKGARKRRKADFESLLYLPGSLTAGTRVAQTGAWLVGLGSGSRPNRRRGVVLALGDDGMPCGRSRAFDLEPLYSPLEARLDKLNIEGAFLLGDELLLLQRGGKGDANLVLRYRAKTLSPSLPGGLAPFNRHRRAATVWARWTASRSASPTAPRWPTAAGS